MDRIELRGNNLTKLPKSISKLSKDCGLDFSGNPLQDSPLSVVLRDGLDGIERYLEDVSKGYKTSNTL